MNPLDQLVSLFVTKYGASPTEAVRQARYYLARPDDEMGASFIQEASQHAADEQARFAAANPAMARPMMSVAKPTSMTVGDLAAADAAQRGVAALGADTVKPGPVEQITPRASKWREGFDPSTLEPAYAQKTGQRDAQRGRAAGKRQER